MPGKKNRPWYAGEHKDALLYLLIAIFFVELIVGGVAFFYGIMHAAPEVPGGPPLARFPWLAWALSALLAPVGLILLVHVAGTWVSGAMTRDEEQAETAGGAESENLSEGTKRFYAAVRHAPTLVILLGLLFMGGALFFVDGALAALGRFGVALLPYLPWLAVSAASLLAICFLAHAVLVYKQRKMENEYAWRREVLQKTGLVLVDKSSLPLPSGDRQAALAITEASEAGRQVLDVQSEALPPGEDDENPPARP